jgi:hypothetical protein
MKMLPDKLCFRPVAGLSGFMLAAMLLPPGWAAGQDLAANRAGIWSIAGAPGMDRWIVVHDPGTSKSTGVYHIEVVGRKTGDPSWQVVHLVPHMAITEQALLDSVIEPLTTGAVYPESFDDAYAAWLASNGGAGGEVCTRTIIECMPEGEGGEK